MKTFVNKAKKVFKNIAKELNEYSNNYAELYIKDVSKK